LVRAKIILKVFMGLFVGLLYLQTDKELDINNYQEDRITKYNPKVAVTNLNGALYFLVNELTYATAMGILSFMPDDYPLVVREYHDGLYYLVSYYSARCLSYVPLFTIDGLLMMGICYYMVGFVPAFNRFVSILGISLLIEQSAAAFGVMLSTCSPSYPVAIAIAAPLLTVLSLTGGLYANVGLLPPHVSWMQYISWFRYGFEAFTINQWDGVGDQNLHKGSCIFTKLNVTSKEQCVRSKDILKLFSFHDNHIPLDVGILLAIICMFYFIGFVGLWIRVRRAR